jgi:K+-sensing histidine kinase KdpD
VPFRAHLSGTNSALILVVVVVAVASNGNRPAGALAAASAAAWFDFFLTRPYERFTITSAADITTAVLLLTVGLAVSQLAARARRLRVVTITSADYLAQIQQTAQLVQSGRAANTVVNQVREQLIRVLQLRGCRFEFGTLLG